MSDLEHGNQAAVDSVANLLMGGTAESAAPAAVPDAVPDDIDTPTEGSGALEETPNPDDLLAELLADPEKDGQASAPERVAPDSLESLAENVGIEVSDLYKIAVPMSDGGEPRTIGELKDTALRADAIEQQQADFETARIEQESTLLKARQELQQLVAAIGQDNLSEQALNLLRQQSAQYLQEQKQQLLTMRPEWSDPAKAQEAQAEIAGAMESYGFTPAERSQVADARLIKAFHDLAVYQKRIKAANDRMRELRGKAKPAIQRGRKGQAAPKSDALIKQAQGAKTSRDKTGAVAALIAQGTK